MRKIAIILLYLIFLISSIKIIAHDEPDEVGNFIFDGHNRNYEVYFPQNFTSNMPIVIALHGWSENIEWYKDYTRMHEAADTMGFVIVYPQGISNSWNSGWYHPNFTYSKANDVGFISALIDTMKTHHDIDLSRVYCCGFSNGGEMSFRLIGEIEYRFAAAASVSGLLFDLANSWEIVRPIPILQMNGTSDRLSPYDGDEYTWSVTETLDYFLDKYNCSLMADTFNFSDIVPNDNCTIQKISYTNCSGESQVVHYKGIGMGHSWPSSTFTFGSEGNKNKDINANVEILNFFKDYQNPLVNLAFGKAVQCYPKHISTLNDNTLDLVANIHNPENHQVEVYASIQLGDSIIVDSIALYDDGLHNDELASDNIFGAKKQFTSLEENIYSIKLHTNDLVDSISTCCVSKEYFTTAGPVEWKSYDITQQNDSAYSMKVTLENNSSNFTISDISARLSTNDTSVTEILANGNPQNYPDIEPGQSVQCSGTWGYIFYAKNNPETVKFVLDIYSEGFRLWTDSIAVLTEIEEELPNLPKVFRLHQNYPNPFNPSTKIDYSIPKQGNVTLKVFNVLGSKVASLINKEQPQGNYELEFDGSGLTSGIYFYRMRVGDFVETKKMILLK